MKRLLLIAAILALAGCVYRGAKVTEGTDLAVGFTVPGTEGAIQFDALNYLTGFRLGVAENAALALYKAVSSDGGWKAWTDAAQKNGVHIEGAEISQNLHENSDASKLPANKETAQT